MDNQNDIEIAAEKLVKENGWSRIKALSAIHSRYQSERRLEGALIVQRLINMEEEKMEAERNKGFHDDM
jgi:hypothetical protein